MGEDLARRPRGAAGSADGSTPRSSKRASQRRPRARPRGWRTPPRSRARSSRRGRGRSSPSSLASRIGLGLGLLLEHDDVDARALDGDRRPGRAKRVEELALIERQARRPTVGGRARRPSRARSCTGTLQPLAARERLAFRGPARLVVVPDPRRRRRARSSPSAASGGSVARTAEVPAVLRQRRSAWRLGRGRATCATTMRQEVVEPDRAGDLARERVERRRCAARDGARARPGRAHARSAGSSGSRPAGRRPTTSMSCGFVDREGVSAARRRENRRRGGSRTTRRSTARARRARRRAGRRRGRPSPGRRGPRRAPSPLATAAAAMHGRRARRR